MSARPHNRADFATITAVVMPDGHWWHPGWRRGRIAGWLPEGNSPGLADRPAPLTLNAKADAWAAKRRSAT